MANELLVVDVVLLILLYTEHSHNLMQEYLDVKQQLTLVFDFITTGAYRTC